MRIVLVIDLATGDMPRDRKPAAAATIADDVRTMMDEKHSDIYRTTEVFTDIYEGGFR
jgi:hypothetical protein